MDLLSVDQIYDLKNDYLQFSVDVSNELLND